MAAKGVPSATARRVAAYRLTFDRLAAPYGDAGADERLARDVAGHQTLPAPGEGMGPLLRGRTGFFDRVVVNAMERGVTQVVSVGAGYDGRALRYAQPGVRWWEIDHPDTQADKRARLERLRVATGHISFVPCDLRDGGVADALLASGYHPDAPALLLCEGVAVYLDVDVLEALLHDLRALATVGTRLAISWRGRIDSAAQAVRRERFEAAVAAAGEPARNQLTSDAAADLLARTRWRATEIPARAQQAGLVMAAPVWAPPIPEPSSPDGSRPTVGRVGGFLERMLYRAGTNTLARHLESTYGVRVVRIKELDLGVHGVDLPQGRWIARLFPAGRTLQAARDDAALLAWLRRCGIPAEEPAAPDPVSEHDGQPVLVTLRATGRSPAAGPGIFAFWGEQLGRLHQLVPDVPPARRPGGAWHHLVLDAGLGEEAAACASLLDGARHRLRPGETEPYDVLAADVAGLGELAGQADFADLPHAFGHADPVPRNLIRGSGQGPPTIIDWAGAGWFPRISSLGCLLWAAAFAGAPSVRAAAAAYAQRVRLDPAELAGLAPAMRSRPLVLAAWSYATGRQTMTQASQYWQAQRAAVSAAEPAAAALLHD